MACHYLHIASHMDTGRCGGRCGSCNRTVHVPLTKEWTKSDRVLFTLTAAQVDECFTSALVGHFEVTPFSPGFQAILAGTALPFTLGLEAMDPYLSYSLGL